MENTTSSASSAIQGIIPRWNQACLDRDWDALLSMCTTDMVFMPPEGSPVAGAAIRPWLEAFPVIKTMWWEVSDLDESGDLAVARGPVKETLEIEGQEVLIDGKYCDVLRRGTDGEWRLSVVMWNSSVP